jgi:hypothetical protein
MAEVLPMCVKLGMFGVARLHWLLTHRVVILVLSMPEFLMTSSLRFPA